MLKPRTEKSLRKSLNLRANLDPAPDPDPDPFTPPEPEPVLPLTFALVLPPLDGPPKLGRGVDTVRVDLFMDPSCVLFVSLVVVMVVVAVVLVDDGLSSPIHQPWSSQTPFPVPLLPAETRPTPTSIPSTSPTSPTSSIPEGETHQAGFLKNLSLHTILSVASVFQFLHTSWQVSRVGMGAKRRM